MTDLLQQLDVEAELCRCAISGQGLDRATFSEWVTPEYVLRPIAVVRAAEKHAGNRHPDYCEHWNQCTCGLDDVRAALQALAEHGESS